MRRILVLAVIVSSPSLHAGLREVINSCDALTLEEASAFTHLLGGTIKANSLYPTDEKLREHRREAQEYFDQVAPQVYEQSKFCRELLVESMARNRLLPENEVRPDLETLLAEKRSLTTNRILLLAVLFRGDEKYQQTLMIRKNELYRKLELVEQMLPDPSDKERARDLMNALNGADFDHYFRIATRPQFRSPEAERMEKALRREQTRASQK